MSGGGGGKSTCPKCGKQGSGNFCQHCGTPMGQRKCAKCQAKLSASAKFCNQCGAPAPGGGGAPAPGRREVAAAAIGGGNAPWWIAGVAMFGVILVVGWNMVSPAGPAAPAGGMPAGAAGNPAVGQSTLDLSSMSPREAADRLFDRVMRTVSAGDTAGALAFQPMAVQAYQVAEPLDLDGLFHQALLEMLADPSAALATAQRILAVEPNHILGLGLAAEASVKMGEDGQATEYYRQLRDNFPTESARGLLEYDGHRNLLLEMQVTAQNYLNGG